jgi:hypothetical protein
MVPVRLGGKRRTGRDTVSSATAAVCGATRGWRRTRDDAAVEERRGGRCALDNKAVADNKLFPVN